MQVDIELFGYEYYSNILSGCNNGDVAGIAWFKMQTVSGLIELCDEARVLFIDEVLSILL